MSKKDEDFLELARNPNPTSYVPKIIIDERKPRKVVKKEKKGETGKNPLIKDPEQHQDPWNRPGGYKAAPTQVHKQLPLGATLLPPDIDTDVTDSWILEAQEKYVEPTPTVIDDTGYDKTEAIIKKAEEALYAEQAKQQSIPAKQIDYDFNEDLLIQELKSYIDRTYTQHYAGKYQATSIIIDAGHGIGFTLGNVIKYAKRYGKKDGYNRLDLLKLIHYSILALAAHDMKEKDEQK